LPSDGECCKCSVRLQLSSFTADVLVRVQIKYHKILFAASGRIGAVRQIHIYCHSHRRLRICSYIIPYIISHHIISYHISYRISYHISYIVLFSLQEIRAIFLYISTVLYIQIERSCLRSRRPTMQQSNSIIYSHTLDYKSASARTLRAH
jgi:hypothetical protein